MNVPSSQLVVNDREPEVYASSACSKPAARVHGGVGWRRKNGSLNGASGATGGAEVEELIFYDPNHTDEGGHWWTLSEYRFLKAAKKKINIEYYDAHPDELKEKITRRHNVRAARAAARTNPIATYIAEDRVVTVG